MNKNMIISDENLSQVNGGGIWAVVGTALLIWAVLEVAKGMDEGAACSGKH